MWLRRRLWQVVELPISLPVSSLQLLRWRLLWQPVELFSPQVGAVLPGCQTGFAVEPALPLVGVGLPGCPDLRRTGFLSRIFH